MNKDIVLIEWADSCGHERWEFLDEIEPMPPHICHTVGYLMDNKKDYKTIASSLSKTQVLGRLTIPSVCIKSIYVLETTGDGIQTTEYIGNPLPHHPA